MPTYYGMARGKTVVLPEGVELPEGQRVEVRLLDDDDTEEPGAQERFERLLLESGLVLEIRRPGTVPPGEDWVPIQIAGKPLSEIIIEERR